MSTTSTEKLKKILQIEEGERLDFEKEILHFAFIEQVQYHMGDMRYSKLAEELNVSKSFVSQLFSGDKLINIDLMAKLQRILHFKFKIDSKCNFVNNEADNNIVPLASYSMETYLNPLKTTSFKTACNG